MHQRLRSVDFNSCKVPEVAFDDAFALYVIKIACDDAWTVGLLSLGGPDFTFDDAFALYVMLACDEAWTMGLLSLQGPGFTSDERKTIRP